MSFGRFRACYEVGLRTDPALAGRVTVKFVIDTQGSVASVSDGGSNISDKEVAACIRRVFSAMDFPAPSSGTGKVTYPILLAPTR
ncbi:MAG: AgmX/PglI C-terminal domain-containing protein [Polyangiaceae bacterium]